MKKIHLEIISILISLITFPFFGILIERLLLEIDIIDDYGYIGSINFEWFYNLFHDKDGLYDAPNLFYYTFSFIITFLIIYCLLNFLNKLSNKTQKSTTN